MPKFHLLGFLMLLVVSLRVFAEPTLSTTISHDAINHFMAGYPISLDAAISDDTGITTSRCYFKTSAASAYVFVPMIREVGNQFHCNIPALNTNVAQLEYLFLVVNSDRQVIRSAVYSAQQQTGGSIPNWQSGLSDNPITVYSELQVIDADSTQIASAQIQFQTITNIAERHGFLLDIYPAELIPAELNAAEGYFGGFALDSILQTPEPVKGFGIGLKPSSSSRSTQQPSTLDSQGRISVGGNGWRGFFQTTGFNNRRSISASVNQSGSSVSMVTSKSGLGHYLRGSTNSRGDMLLYDQYDGEDWTTHRGPATDTHIAIYDYICPTCSQLNEINISRTLPPIAPTGVSASDGIYLKEIAVSWSTTSGASSYDLYRCTTSSTSSCSKIADTHSTYFDDQSAVLNSVYYYRVIACNKVGCSGYSSSDSGYLKSVTIAPILYLLLLG